MTAVQAVIDAFLFQPFVWGQADCAALAATALTELGHSNPLANVRRYTTERGAKRALLKLGHRSLEDAVDALGLTRITPAQTLPGDLIAIGDPMGQTWSALGVSLGDDRALAFVTQGDATVCTWGNLAAATSAWRSI